MKPNNILKISGELEIQPKQVKAVYDLLNQDATVPFISRYRKEVTGGLDEVVITDIRDKIIQYEELDKRRDAIIASLEKRELLTDELKVMIDAAETMTELEDIYLPYKPKRKTRASAAKEKGLEPLANILFLQEINNVFEEAKKYINIELGVNSAEEAISGARDIIAEWINENKDAREALRELMTKEAFIYSKASEEDMPTESRKFEDYFNWKENAYNAPSHRVLAMFRGENEGFLKLEVYPSEDNALNILNAMFIKGKNESSNIVKESIDDCYKRLLCPGMETEFRNIMKEKADEEAINVFANNLKELLLAAPLGQKNVLAIDPGFRTGCKIACLNKQGKLLHNQTVYPHNSSKLREDEKEKIKQLCIDYSIEAIAIGNGTAGRETEVFIREINLSREIIIVMVNESGASIYSASEVAREEFPDYDVTVRGAVSIGRRLIDPLSELVKIDPKSIGVGQYQHDVHQPRLRNKLNDVVISCVNSVGVELNTASKELLSYVSGLGPKLAKGIIDFRNEKGPFKSRAEIKKVPRLGSKAFEQAAGFLRVKDSVNVLDETAVHPESYFVVENIATKLNVEISSLIRNGSLINSLNLKEFETDTVGTFTLEDIKSELLKPGRDPRKVFEIFKFSELAEKIEDLQPGMKLPGIITNVTNFGIFVDIGVHQDGLVHLSQIANKFVKNPVDLFKVHQKVNVTVISIDAQRKRIQLSMKDETQKREEVKREKKKKNENTLNVDKLINKFGKN